MSEPELSDVAQALGRIPTGLYIVSTTDGTTPLGFVGSFVMQVGFDPPTVCVAVAHGRGPLAALRSSGSFAVSVLGGGSGALMSPFFKPTADGATPFDGLATATAPSGAPVLSDALAWLDCEVSGEQDVGDHVVVFGRVVAAQRLRDGDPAVHLRKDGLGY